MRCAMNNFKVKFYGVRGSTPFDQGEQVGGNTSCIGLTVGDKKIIMDAGTGILAFQEELEKSNQNLKELHLLLSHYHWDHVLGLLCFKPLFQKSTHIHFYGEEKSGESVESILKKIMMEPYFPIKWAETGSQKSYHGVKDQQEFTIGPVVIKTYELSHPGKSMGYKCSYKGHHCCYMTDVDVREENKEQVGAFIKDADLVIIDSYFDEANYVPGWGHSTWKDVITLCAANKVKALALFHHKFSIKDQELREIEAMAKTIMPSAFVACEGMELSLLED